MADIMAKTIKFPGLNNTYEFMQPDGTYPDLTAGNIISNDAYTEDTEPYLFRSLPYKSKRLEESLVGGTVNWNQLCNPANITFNGAETKNGVTITHDGNGGFSFSGTATADTNFPAIALSVITGHKYFTAGLKNNGSLSTFYSGISGNASDLGNGGIWNGSATGNAYARINIKNGVDMTNIAWKPIVIDLTAMFGSTIADYVYSLEQATAGSGIAWLKSYGFLTKPYYEYDAGTLKSVNPTSHKMIGVNQWDEEIELGRIDISSGENVTATDRLRSKNYVQVIPNTTYYFSCQSLNGYHSANVYGYLYDANKTFLQFLNINNTTISIPSDCHYIRFMLGGAYGTTFKNDVCINISDPTINGKYFQYEEHTYDLGNVPLYGVFQLVDNKLKAYGDVRHADGGTDRNFALLDLGTLNWEKNGNVSQYFATLPIGAVERSVNAIASRRYSVSENGAYDGNIDKSLTFMGTTTPRIWVRDSNYSTSAELKTAMNGVYLVYPVATPTTEQTDQFEKIQSCFPYGTEKYITTNGVPVGHDTKYFKDVITNIAGIPEPPSGNGTYELKLTVTDGVASYSWVAV